MTSDSGSMGQSPTTTAAVDDQVALADSSDRKLRRALTFQDLFMISFGGVVGSGWLFAVSFAALLAGPASVVAWVICGIFMMAIGLVFAEIASSLHRSGQLVRGPLYSHGGFTGYIIASAYILGSITVPAIEAEAVITYISTSPPGILPAAINPVNGLLTGEGVFIAVLLLIGFFFLNYVGVRFLGLFNSVVTWWKLIIPTLTIIFLFTIFSASNFTTSYNGLNAFAPFGWPGIFTSIPTAGIGFAYLGFRGAAQFSGEAKNPQRDAPRAIVLSISAAVVLYVLLEVVFIGSVRWTYNEFCSAGTVCAAPPPGDWAAIAGPIHTAPFYTVMKFAGPALLAGFASFLLADAVISPAGTGWVFLGEATRAVYGVGADGFFPKPLLRIQQRTRIPWIALIATTIIGGVFIAPFPSWFLFAEFVTDAFAVSLIMGPLTLLALRRHAPNLKRPYRLPLPFWIGAVAFIGGAFVIYWTAWGGLFYVMTVIFLVLPLFYFFYAPRFMGIPRGTSLAIGITQLVLTVAITTYGYIALYVGDVVSLSPVKPPASDGTLISTFAIYYIAFLLIVLVPTILAYRLSNPAGKKMINAGWWVIVLLFGMYVINFFTVYNSWSAVGGLLIHPNGYIPTPYDTPVFLVFAAVIYVWGIYSGYRTKDLEDVEQLLSRPDADKTADELPSGMTQPDSSA
jgi:amino acid transporter